MAAPGSNNQQGKKDRREAAREKARLEREAEKRRQRRNRIFIQGGIGVVVLAIVAVVALVIVNVNKPAGPGPLNMASDGILLSGANMTATKTTAIKAGATPVVTNTTKLKPMVNIVTYIDYQCPYCQQFETTNADQIATWVKAAQATIEIHPIAILDSSSLGNKYSTRAANAAACVANYDPNNYYAVNTALFANQPAEKTSGKTDSELFSTVSGAGSGSANVKSCITSQQFVPWVTAATARVHPSGDQKVFTGVAKTPITFGGTPTVFVNGVQYTGSLTDATAFATFTAQQVTG
jgi:protein-disulfide isomerase